MNLTTLFLRRFPTLFVLTGDESGDVEVIVAMDVMKLA